MGQSQSATSSWSVDDWAFGTGANAISTEEVITETSKLPAKLFGGEAIEQDSSMHQMQRDLLSFDDTLKRIFLRRKKNKRPSRQIPQDDAYYYQTEEVGAPIDGQLADPNYLPPVPVISHRGSETPAPPLAAAEAPPEADAAVKPLSENPSAKLFWRCTQCTADNKVTESSCRRCGTVETAL